MHKKSNISIVEIKENLQKEQLIKGKRSEKDLNIKEVELFELLFPMTPNKALSEKFLISTEDVERLAHKLKLQKDPAFTRYQMSGTKGGKALSDGSPRTPGYLLNALQRKVTEEEKRELMTTYEEGLDPEQMLEELALTQMVRIQRGVSLEYENESIWRSVNEAIDGLHNILKTIHELKHGQKMVHELGNTFEEMVLRSKNAG
jgi:hypothetical protein